MNNPIEYPNFSFIFMSEDSNTAIEAYRDVYILILPIFRLKMLCVIVCINLLKNDVISIVASMKIIIPILMRNLTVLLTLAILYMSKI